MYEVKLALYESRRLPDSVGTKFLGKEAHQTYTPPE